MSANTNRVEYKQGWDPDFMRVICAFANAQGGTLFIGMKGSGSPTADVEAARLLEHIPIRVWKALGVVVEAELQRENEKDTIAVSVRPSPVPISLRGRYFLRSGRATLELEGAALNGFMLSKSDRDWDCVPDDRATLEDIDEGAVKVFLRGAVESGRIPDGGGLSTPDLFEKLHIAKNGKLKRAALVFFGREPGRFYPGLSVLMGIKGPRDTDPRFQASEEGNIIHLLDAVPRRLGQILTERDTETEGAQSAVVDKIPKSALREALLNALIHRVYSGAHTQIRLWHNSLYVWNEGSLPDGLSVDMLHEVHPSRPRNRLLAEVAFWGGFMDAWGDGISKIAAACSMAGLPPAVFREYGGGFLAKLPWPALSLDVPDHAGASAPVPVRRRILRMLAAMDGEMTREQIQQKLCLSEKKYFVQNYLHVGLSLGLIEMAAPDLQKNLPRKYYLTEKGRQTVEGLGIVRVNRSRRT